MDDGSTLANEQVASGGNPGAFHRTPVGPRGAYAGLTARDFYQFDGPPCGTGEACPDLAAGAAPLRFGFLRIADAWVEGPVVHGIDNWRVAVWPR